MHSQRYKVTIWERIRDKTEPRIRELVKEISHNIFRDKSIIRFQDVDPTPPLLYEILEQRANEWLIEVYKICCDARNDPKEPETPDFNRAVWTFLIEPFINEELPDLLLLGAGWDMAEGCIIPADILTPDKAPMLESRVSACDWIREKVRAEWMQKLVAGTGEYETQDTTGPVRKIPKAASAQKRKQTRDPRHAEIAVIKARTPGIPQLEVCHEMDRRLERNPALGPRDTWVTKSNERTWVGNYNHKKTKSAVAAYVTRS